jgi:hypothetical protein
MNLTQIPIIGALIQKGENLLASGVQTIKERVADFHLIPRRITNFNARADQLSRLPTVGTNTDDMGTIVGIRNRSLALQSSYDSANRQLDLAMTEVNKIQSGGVSISGASLVASTIAAMNDVFSQAATIDNMLATIEQRVLTPQQLSNVKMLGLAPLPTSPFSNPKTLGLVAGGIVVFMLMRRRRRR